ncbi:T-cell immunoglobulin and mucin domain-containing protein 4, partial [Pterocles gutturalis]
HTASEAVVRGVTGQPVQLPCFYRVAQRRDISDVCWGRGPCPNSKCNNKILHTTGNRVSFRQSQRYSLQGYISYGDVSLTIGNLKAEDAGTYCCRIEVPGWFNDIKKHIRLEVVRAPPVRTTTTRKTPVPTRSFRKTTFAPQTTSDRQTAAETAVLLTTTVLPATTAATKPPAVVTLETTAPPTFAVTATDTFPETMVTTSAVPDFSTDVQAADMSTEDYDVFCSTEPVSLPGVTAKFPSTLPTSEGIDTGADTSLMVEGVPTAATTPPAPTTLHTLKRTLTPELLATKATYSSMNRSEGNLLLKPFQFFSSPFQFPSYAILIACVIVVSVLFILMPSLFFWKRKHTKKFIMKSPAEDVEKIFSGAEGENSIFSL